MIMSKIKDLFAGKKKDAAPKRPEVINVDVKEAASAEPLSLQIEKLEAFQDTEHILESLRTGKRILLIKIAPLKEKDMTELKRAINRFKTSCAATGSDLAAIDDNWVILVPPTVGLERV